jgi:exopolyphosphatase/guanosine-5'-triphosphate,3'-diphosphate pyrophosphatase
MKTTDPIEKIRRTEVFAERSDRDKAHTGQVRRLSLRMFDELAGLHGLGQKERPLLDQAAILHDIASREGKAHHKEARDIVLESPEIPFDDDKDRVKAAMVVRYHKGALPDPKHRHYEGLDRDSRVVVDKLASIIRMADGLDRTHSSVVKDLRCRISNGKLTINVISDRYSDIDDAAAKKKADLFEKVFGLKTEFKWKAESGK